MNKHLWVVGNGYVGSVLAELARNAGCTVTTISRSGEGDEHADVASRGELRALSERVGVPTHVVHCASASGGGEDAYRRVYLEGCVNLSELFSECHLVFTSSTSVLAQENGERVDETAPVRPTNRTGKILAEAENVVIRSGGSVVRLAGVYGDGRCYFLKRFFSGEAEMEEDGSRILNHTHRRDAASALFHILEIGEAARGEIYHACDSHPLSQLETYRALCAMFHKEMPRCVPRNLAAKRGWSNKAVANAKLRGTGWEPQYPSLVDAAAEIAASLGFKI